jgi:hypothetical protein
MAQLLGEDLVPCPYPYKALFGSRFRRLVLGRVANPGSSVKKAASRRLALALLNLKKCTTILPDSHVVECYKGHAKALSTSLNTRAPKPGGIKPSTTPYQESAWRDMTLCYDRILDALFSSKKRKRPEAYEPVPTGKSCYELSRKKGGNRAHLVYRPTQVNSLDLEEMVETPRGVREIRLPRPEATTIRCCYPEIPQGAAAVCSTLLEDLKTKEKTKSSHTTHIPHIPPPRTQSSFCRLAILAGLGMEDADECDEHCGFCSVDESETPHDVPEQPHMHKVTEAISCHTDSNDSLRLPASAYGICEPLKVRIITRGPAILYREAKRVQMALTDMLKNTNLSLCLPSFKRPISADDINQERFQNFELMLSGDYSAATDGIPSEVSEYFLVKILDRFGGTYDDPDFRRLMLSTLTGHRIEYPEQVIPAIDQECGQLMGSLMSFNILCLINLSINYAFLERQAQGLPTTIAEWNLNPQVLTRLLMNPWEHALYVNGDDVLMNIRSPDGWADYILAAGFTKSLGKNYTHGTVCCINSQFYWKNAATWERFTCPRPDKIYNTCWHMDRDERDDTHDPLWRVGPGLAGELADQLIASFATDAGRVAALDAFKKTNKNELIDSRSPWTVPTALGGLGLPGVRSELDAKYCALLLRLAETKTKIPVTLTTIGEPLSSPADLSHAHAQDRYRRSKGWTKVIVKCWKGVLPCSTAPPSLPTNVLAFCHHGLLTSDFDSDDRKEVLNSNRSFLRNSERIRHLLARSAGSSLNPYYGDVQEMWVRKSHYTTTIGTMYLSGPAPLLGSSER